MGIILLHSIEHFNFYSFPEEVPFEWMKDVYKRQVYSGYALGMGFERITNLKYQVKDLRMFSENDTRFLKEFEAAY